MYYTKIFEILVALQREATIVIIIIKFRSNEKMYIESYKTIYCKCTLNGKLVYNMLNILSLITLISWVINKMIK